MAFTLSDTRPVARKNHECDVCQRVIAKGERYRREIILGDSFYTWKTCEGCCAAVPYILDYSYTEDGWSYDTASEWATDMQTVAGPEGDEARAWMERYAGAEQDKKMLPYQVDCPVCGTIARVFFEFDVEMEQAVHRTQYHQEVLQ